MTLRFYRSKDVKPRSSYTIQIIWDVTPLDFMHPLLSAMFTDETEAFRSPAEPDPGDTVYIRFRAASAAESVSLVTDGGPIRMEKRRSDGRFDWYEAAIPCGADTTAYHFLVTCAGHSIMYLKDGARFSARDAAAPEALRFRFTPGFHPPQWAQGAVQYQIFPDRFRNGDNTNDVLDGEYSYDRTHVRRIADWDSPPPVDGYRCFYGGDLAGIMEKLDYLQALGVEVLYLNPVFLSPSSHKYDTQDYDHIDPHLGVIEEDAEHTMQPWEHHNGYAVRYIKRVLSQINLEKSDALFATLCTELHRRGMRIILDGVFNHCGSFHRWMDREGIYRDKPGFAPGAYQDEHSPYRGYFRFTDEKPGYEAWWGVDTLPKLNYEDAPALREEILSVAEKWLRPPYAVDGWRLDVAADLGHSRVFNHGFWKEFRSRVKAIRPDALIVAEHYGDATDWLQGDEWDTVMNYDAFMEPLTFFLTGLEKHSDGRRDELRNDGPAFFEAIFRNMARFHTPSLMCAMNELSNHDHSRFLTRTNRRVGRVERDGAAAAGEGIDKCTFRIAVTIQMTWPGAPTIYYADEAGQVGGTDPDNRRTYPWGHEDRELIELHRALTRLRQRHPLLRRGSFKPLFAGTGTVAYARFDGSGCVVVACNNTDAEALVPMRLCDVGVPDGARLPCALLTGPDGHSADAPLPPLVSDAGHALVRLPPVSAAVFVL